MVDALGPAVAALRERLDAGDALAATRSRRPRDAADEGARATTPMQARKGRASYLGERSVGHQDPGATSTALIIRGARRRPRRAGLMVERILRGLPASPGLAIGCARVLGGAAVARETVPQERRPAQVERAHAALRAAAAELEALAERVGGDEAEIVRAGVLMAGDPVLVDDVERAVLDGLPAAAALEAATSRHAAAIAALDDETLAARAEDVRSLGRRAIRLAGAAGEPSAPSARADAAGVILVADELGPADVAELGPEVVGHRARGRGSDRARRGRRARARAAARGRARPAAAADAGERAAGGGRRRGCRGAVARGRPRPRRRGRPGGPRRPSAHRRSPTARCRPSRSTVTPCGCWSTPPRAAELDAGLAAGAEGVGLLRTELAFLEAETWPTEAEHRAALAPVLAGPRRPHRHRARARLRRRQDAALPRRHPRARARAAARPPRRARRPAARDRRRRPRHRAADPAADGRDRRAGARGPGAPAPGASASAR